MDMGFFGDIDATDQQTRMFANIVDSIEHSTALIGIYDEVGQLRFSNAAYRDAHFITAQEDINWAALTRRNFGAARGVVIETDDIDAWISGAPARRRENAVSAYETNFHDGSKISVVETQRPNGWVMYVGTNITPTNLHTAEVKSPQIDELTGIPNRRHVMLQLDKMIAGSMAAGGTVCLIGIDHFNVIKDSFGQHVADQVLTTFAEIVRSAVRIRDVFARMDGEGFLLIMPGTISPEGQMIMKRVFEKVHKTLLVPTIPDLRITISAGFTMIDKNDNAANVYARCEQALCSAQTNGRNQLSVWALDAVPRAPKRR